MRFAEKLAVDHHKVDDALWSELRRHFSEAEIIELVAHTTLYIGFGRFNEIVGTALRDKAISEKLEVQGIVPRILTPAQARAFVASEAEKFGKIVAQANIKAEN